MFKVLPNISIPKIISIWKPFKIQPLVIPEIFTSEYLSLFGQKNSRKPNRANHGARPCSSFMRRLKRRELHGKFKAHEGGEEFEEHKMMHLHDEIKREIQEEENAKEN